jgi:outer membrane receptor protein involved in Fe transport
MHCLRLVGALRLSLLAGAVAAGFSTSTSTARAQGAGVLTGTVVDAATKRPIPDVVVTVTSPALQGQQSVVTDKSGSYRIPNLPPGTYTLRLEGEAYKPLSRDNISIRLDTTIRTNVELLPEGIRAEEVVVLGKAPSVDVGSSSTGVSIDQDFVSRVPLSPPGGRAAASRSFESLATVAPGAQIDAFGISIAGTTSPENAFLIDGVSVGDPAFGILGTPLSSAFIKEMSVITGGYLPEYGRATGGIYDVVTKSGGNEFHGSAFFNITPGIMDGPRHPLTSAGSSITTNQRLGSQRDFGAEVGGPIRKDRLWFYAGVDVALTTYDLERNLSQFKYVNDPMHPGATMPQIDPGTGLPVTQPITCSQNPSPIAAACPQGAPASPVFLASQMAIQYIGKLTFLVNQDHKLTLSVYGTPTRSGGNGAYAFGAQTEAPLSLTGGNLVGSYGALGTRVASDSNDVSLKYSAAFNDKRQLFDLTLGWHHQHQATNAGDGSTVDQTNQPGVLAGAPQVIYRQSQPDFHSITNFEGVPAGACPATPVWNGAGLSPVTTCPLTSYYRGGPGFLDDVLRDSYQAKAVYSHLTQLAGHHVVKAGVDVAFSSYRHDQGFSGTNLFLESPQNNQFVDFRQLGFLQGPDSPVVLAHYVTKTTSTSIGGFLQDSWAILDRVTLNLGVRYDAQVVYGADGELGLALPNQVSPRVGVIYDFTQQGRSKLYANYARYYEGVPLDVADRAFPSAPLVTSTHAAPPCNPAIPANVAPGGSCTTDAGRVGGSGSAYPTPPTPNGPSQIWSRVGGGKEAVDPNVQAQSTDEYLVGGEYEVFSDARFGIGYTHRELHRVLEDMSHDEGNTYFIGNPGYGIASDFPKAVRNYDAMTLYFNKAYANTWLLAASYTLSRLYGNYAGLFRPESGQLNPNNTSYFDLKSLLPNQLGPLPGDHTHQIKIFAAKDFLLPARMDVLIGLTYRGLSGAPLDALGAHPIYGPNEVYVLPRGSGGTLSTRNPGDPGFGTVVSERGPWLHDIDLRLGYSAHLTKESALTVTADIFNLFNFQAATQIDQAYTLSNVLPCASGQAAPTCLRHSDGSAFNPAKEVNPNYGNAIAYQDPRQFRLGAKITF